MIVAGIILGWFALSVILLVGLAWAASRRAPTPGDLFGDLASPSHPGFCDATPSRADIQHLREAVA